MTSGYKWRLLLVVSLKLVSCLGKLKMTEKDIGILVRIITDQKLTNPWILGNFTDKGASSMAKTFSKMDQFVHIVADSKVNMDHVYSLEKHFVVFADNGLPISEVDIAKLTDLDRLILILPFSSQTFDSIFNQIQAVMFKSKIHQNIKMLRQTNASEWELSEAYTINGVRVANKLGSYVHVKGRLKNEDTIKFLPNDGVVQNFEDRRSNFYGVELKTMTERSRPFLDFLEGFDKVYFPENQTYDVTGYTTGFYADVLENLQARLNFTSRLYKRKDSQWATKVPLPNGSYELVGAVGDLIQGNADMFASSVSLHADRISFIDYLTVLSGPKAGIAIRNDLEDKLSWNLFFDPFTPESWLMLILLAFVLALILAMIDNGFRLLTAKSFIVTFLLYLWTALMSNFSKPPDRQPKLSAGKAVLFVCMLAGTLTWMSYRASLTSKLSVNVKKLPFTSLQTLPQSGYKLSTFPRGHLYSEMFAQPEKGSVYEEIWETSMSDESFINPEIGMERVMGEPKQAYWALIQNVLAFTKYRCKVLLAVRMEKPITYESIAMPKKSPYTMFLRKVVVQMKEIGQLDILWDHYRYREPTCENNQSGESLTISKLIAAFMVGVIGLVLAFVTFAFESIYWRIFHSNFKGNFELDEKEAVQAEYRKFLVEVKVAYDNLNHSNFMNPNDVAILSTKVQTLMTVAMKLQLKNQ